MLHEACDLVAAALANPTYGVAAQLTVMPLAVGDTTPTTPQLIVSVYTSDQAARGQTPIEDSVLVVFPEGSARIDQQAAVPTRLSRNVTVGVSYVVRGTQDTSDAMRRAAYVLRAVQWCLESWGLRSPQADRQIRNVNVHGTLNTEVVEATESIQGGTIRGVVTVTLDCRDVGRPAPLPPLTP